VLDGGGKFGLRLGGKLRCLGLQYKCLGFCLPGLEGVDFVQEGVVEVGGVWGCCCCRFYGVWVCGGCQVDLVEECGDGRCGVHEGFVALGW